VAGWAVLSVTPAKPAVTPDCTETGTYAVAAAITRGRVTLKGTRYDLLNAVSTAMRQVGVNVEPTAADLSAIPASDRHNWCVQEKIEYEPALQAADGGGVKIEIRMMFLRPDDQPKPLLAQNLVRLSRGKMLGVDFNKQFTWVGSSIALSPES